MKVGNSVETLAKQVHRTLVLSYTPRCPQGKPLLVCSQGKVPREKTKKKRTRSKQMISQDVRVYVCVCVCNQLKEKKDRLNSGNQQPHFPWGLMFVCVYFESTATLFGKFFFFFFFEIISTSYNDNVDICLRGYFYFKIIYRKKLFGKL